MALVYTIYMYYILIHMSYGAGIYYMYVLNTDIYVPLIYMWYILRLVYTSAIYTIYSIYISVPLVYTSAIKCSAPRTQDVAKIEGAHILHVYNRHMLGTYIH